MPAFSSVPALSSLAPAASASTSAPAISASPAFSQPLQASSTLEAYSQLSSAFSALSNSQPQPPTSASPLPPHPSLNHIVQALRLRGNVTTQPHPDPSSTSSTDPSLITSTSTASAGPSSKKWLPGVIVAAVVVVVAAGLLAFWLVFRRRRRQRYEQARQNDPQLTPDQFRRRSHMSEAALMAEAEHERRNIIRKSLISRSSASLSYLGAAGEVAGPDAVDGEMEESYRGIPSYQRQPVPRPPLQPQQSQSQSQSPSPHSHSHSHSHGQCDLAHDHENEPHNDCLQDYADLGGAGAVATTPLMPESFNVAAPPPAAGGLRDDYKEWTAGLRRHTSRVADRHPSLTNLTEVTEEDEAYQREPLVSSLGLENEIEGGRPTSPPIPPRSRLRPLSIVGPLDVASVGFGSGIPPRQDSTASSSGGFQSRQVHSDPRNNNNNEAAGMASPTSLYSVDFSQVGRRRISRRLFFSPTTHSPLFRQLALTLLSDKTDAHTSDLVDLTPEEANKSIDLVLDTWEEKTRQARQALTKSKRSRQSKSKKTKSSTKSTILKTAPIKTRPTLTQTKLVAATRKPLKELHNKPSPSLSVTTSSSTSTSSTSTSSSTTTSPSALSSTPSSTPLKMDAATAAANAARDAYKENLDNIVMCPDCKEFPPNLVEEFSSGDMVCDSCGLVVGDRIIDSRSEWRTFANDDQGNDDPSRVGESANSLANDEGLRTQVDMRAANGKLAGKLNSINKKSQSEKLNNDLQEGFRAISGLVDMMQTSGIVGQTAMHIYKLAYEHGQLKGKPREAVIAGCIFIACRQCGVPRTFREIYAITRVTKKEIGRVFKSLESFLSKIQEKNPQASAAQGVKDYKASSSTTAEELCTRYCSLLGFRNTPRMEKISKALARKTTGIPDLAGRSPLSVAAACIYFASQYLDDPRASKDIASIAGVSDGTIKTAYRFLYNTRTTLVESDWNGNLDNLSSS